MTGSNRLCWTALLVSAGIYGAFAASFFPSPSGRLGEDYSYFLPLLLAGRYWIAANGLFAVPHFSPAFCAGLPFLANPQSIFYSVPQALAELVNPQASFLATTLLFAWLGAGGTFALLRVRFGTSVAAACLGAVIFLFNGFLLYRMAIGHVTYHAVGLLPLLCYVLLTPIAGRPDRFARAFAASALGGVILTYFVYAGAANICIPLGLAVLAVWLLHALVRRPVASFWPVGLAAGLLAAAGAAAKLAPAFVFVTGFPRADRLFLFPDFGVALYALFVGLFLPSALPAVPLRHEFEFGLGPVPFLLLLAGAGVAIARGALRHRPEPRSWLVASALAAVLIVPLWLNFGGAEFAAWLKSLPYIRENAILVRWFFVYLLPVTIAAALLLDFVFASQRARRDAALAGMLATVAAALLGDTTHYRQQRYDPTAIVAADRALRQTGAPPVVAAIAAGREAQHNDGLAAGQSAFPCYEPLFGYHLQSFPRGARFGPQSFPGDHLRNPACYLYGRENGCSPGDGFSAATAGEASSFAAYRPFDYRRPSWQKAADLASVIGLTAMLAGIVLGLRGILRCLLPPGRWRPAGRSISR